MSAADGDEQTISEPAVAQNDTEENPSAPAGNAALPASEPDNDEDKGNEESDDNSGGSNDSDGSDEEPVESLLQGRERRSNQANRYASLLQQETVDEEGNDEFNDIFREGGDEDTDFEGSDAAEASHADDDDDDSSSDDEDQGPAAGAGDLEGEKELRKEERAANRVEKRKAFTKMPTVRKRVKIDDSATPDSTRTSTAAGPADRKRKMSERLSWMPTDPPARTSSRTLSVKNKERTMASMKESEQKRLKQVAIMEAAQKRREEAKAPPMTQAERLAEAARTEELNSRSLSRWEEMEEEKARKQAARLEAMHNRKIEGPFIRWYSAKAEWVNDRLVLHGKSRVKEAIYMHEEEEEVPEKRPGRRPKVFVLNDADNNGPTGVQSADQESRTPAPVGEQSSAASPAHENALDDFKQGLLTANKEPEDSATKAGESKEPAPQNEQPSHDNGNAQNPVEKPIPHESEENTAPPNEGQPNKEEVTTLTEAEQPENTAASSTERPPAEDITKLPPDESQVDTKAANSQPPQASESVADDTAVKEEPETQADTAPPEKTAPTEENDQGEPESTPVIEHTARNVITLENYDNTSISDPIVRRLVVFGTPLPPNFAPSAYTTKRSLLPPKVPKPAQAVCCITRQPAKFRDPATGLPYATMNAYKAIQNVVKGKAVWSDLVGAWVGGDGQAADGGAASGVPEGFFSGIVPERNDAATGQSTDDGAVKTETVV